MNTKTVVITGGTGGLGKAVTQAFLDADYQVIVTYHADTELKDLLDQVGEQKNRLDARAIDVTDEASLDDLHNHIEKKYGHLDSLVCLVGGWAPGTLGENIGNTFDKMMTLNAKSFLLTVNALAPLMMEKKPTHWHHIVGVAARPALEPMKGNGIYAASKAAVANLIGTLSKELIADHITVNGIAPSTIDTAANRQAMPKVDPSIWVKPEELAAAIVFLCSENANPISGEVLPVYGQA